METFLSGAIVGTLFGSTATGWLLPKLVAKEFEMRLARRASKQMHPSNIAKLPCQKPQSGNVFPFPNQRKAE